MIFRRLSRLQDLSIKYKLFLSYLVLILIPLCMFLYINASVSQRENEKDVLYSARQVLGQTRAFLEFKTESAVNSLNMIALNDTVQELSQKNRDLYQNNIGLWLLDSGTLDKVFLVSKSNPDIRLVRLYMKDGLISLAQNETFKDLNRYRHSVWYKSLMEEKNKIKWFGNGAFPQEGDEPYIHVIRSIPSSTNLLDSIGAVQLSLPASTFQSILDQSVFTPSSKALILNGRNEIIGTSSQFGRPDLESYNGILSAFASEDLGTGRLKTLEVNGEKLLVGAQHVGNTDWTLLLTTPYADIHSQSNKSRKPMILVFLVIALFTLPFSFFAASTAIKRIRALMVLMRKAVRGDYQTTLVPGSADEIGELIRSFNHMLTTISGNIEEKYLLGKEIKNLELRALQAQIDPHFLYNTLDLINWMSVKNKVPEIGDVVVALSKFYKLSLSDGQDIISIRNELEHVKTYIDIQNMRFDGSIRLEIEVPEIVLSRSVIKIVLQPIVENAIIHGILEKPEERGTISIRSDFDGRTITLYVRDDGVGMPADRIAKIMSDAYGPKDRLGYGLKNIHERIQLVYGEEFGLAFESEPGKGTTVSVRIPALLDAAS